MLHHNIKQFFQQQRFLTAVLTAQFSLLIAIAVLLSSCGNNKTADTNATPQIVVSIPPLEFFAREIGGDSINVTTLLPAGADPETFEPGINAMRTINRAGAIIISGKLPFENTVTKGLTQNNSSIRTFDMSQGITLIYGTHSHNHNHENPANETSEPDPHIWASVKNSRIIAENMRIALSEISPRHSDFFASRCASLQLLLDSIDNDFASRLDSIPSRAFMIWHPALSYFARDYNLTQIAFNIENKETSSLQLQQAMEKARDLNPTAFFIPTGLPQRQSESISKASGIAPVEINFMSENWLDDTRKIVDAITSARK